MIVPKDEKRGDEEEQVSEEYESFVVLTKKLLTVSKKDLDEARSREEAAKDR